MENIPKLKHERLLRPLNGHKLMLELKISLSDLISVYDDVLHARDKEPAICVQTEDILDLLLHEINKGRKELLIKN